MDSLVTHEVIQRLGLWYRWQLTYSEKRIFLRRFPQFVSIGFAKQKIPGIQPFIKQLVMSQGEEQTFITRNSAIIRLFRLFDYIDTNKVIKNKPINYNTQAAINARADTFISQFDTMMRDLLLAKDTSTTKRHLVRQIKLESEADLYDFAL